MSARVETTINCDVCLTETSLSDVGTPKAARARLGEQGWRHVNRNRDLLAHLPQVIAVELVAEQKAHLDLCRACSMLYLEPPIAPFLAPSENP